MLAVVSVEIHLLDLAHKGISGVSAGALVIECLLYHLVEVSKEYFLVNAVVLDGLLDAYASLKIVDSLDKSLKLLGVVITLDAEVISDLCISCKSGGWSY